MVIARVVSEWSTYWQVKIQRAYQNSAAAAAAKEEASYAGKQASKQK